MTAAVLLDRLEQVRERGAGKWIACCPAHEDRNPSLSIRESDDTVLLHCFAGCDAAEVLDAIGLTLADLYPERDRQREHHTDRHRPTISPRDALTLLRREAAIIAIASRDMLDHGPLLAADHDRLTAAAGRVATIASDAL